MKKIILLLGIVTLTLISCETENIKPDDSEKPMILLEELEGDWYFAEYTHPDGTVVTSCDDVYAKQYYMIIADFSFDLKDDELSGYMSMDKYDICNDYLNDNIIIEYDEKTYTFYDRDKYFTYQVLSYDRENKELIIKLIDVKTSYTVKNGIYRLQR